MYTLKETLYTEHSSFILIKNLVCSKIIFENYCIRL